MTINHGKSFGTAREKLPDRSYLVPQLHKVPGPGQVIFERFSTIMKNKRDKIIVLPLAQSLLI